MKICMSKWLQNICTTKYICIKKLVLNKKHKTDFAIVFDLWLFSRVIEIIKCPNWMWCQIYFFKMMVSQLERDLTVTAENTVFNYCCWLYYLQSSMMKLFCNSECIFRIQTFFLPINSRERVSPDLKVLVNWPILVKFGFLLKLWFSGWKSYLHKRHKRYSNNPILDRSFLGFLRIGVAKNTPIISKIC